MLVIKKIMLDTNIFDKIPDFIDEMKDSIRKGYEYYITVVQVEELSKIPESKEGKRFKSEEILSDLKVEVLPSSSIFHGESGRVLNSNSIDDSIIAATSVYEGCTLVTEDKELYRYMKEDNLEVMYFDEFLLGISG